MKSLYILILILTAASMLEGQDLIGAQVTGRDLPIAADGVSIFLYTDYHKHIHRDTVQLYGNCQRKLPLVKKDTIGNQYIIMEFFDTVFCSNPGFTQYYLLLDSALVGNINNIDSSKRQNFYLSTSMREYFFYPLYNPPIFTFPLNVSVDSFGIVSMNIQVEDEEGDLFLVYVDTLRHIGYQLPQAFYTGGYWIDNNTHTLYWDAPTDTGKFLIALEAIEFTPNGTAINRIKYTQVVEIDASMLVNNRRVLPSSFSVEIFPNPSTDVLNISLKDQHDRVDHILLVGTNGQVVETIENPAVMTTLNTVSYPKGNYFLVFKTDKGVFTRKVVFQ